MPWEPLPPFAAWRHGNIADGFEVLYVRADRLCGHTTAIEDGAPYAVAYEITVDERWRTRAARVRTDTLGGPRETLLKADGEGRWTVDGAPAPQLDGLLDVDLEASACTNLLPVHRLATPVGERVDAPAAWVRALDLSVHRLEQSYTRRDEARFDYASEGDFSAVMTFDRFGLVVDYPGIARRVA